MPTDIPLRCACGALQGTALDVSPRSGCRVVCYCDDCQAYARFLQQPGITDKWGGTDVFQLAPAKLRLTGKMEALSCVRLSEKGMYRWYCGVCRTPIGNVRPPLPFVGVIHSFMDHKGEGRAGDEVLGQPLGYVQTKFAVSPLPADRKSSMGRVIGRSVKLLTKWWVTGAGSPSPFFEGKPRVPRAKPRILSPEERRAL